MILLMGSTVTMLMAGPGCHHVDYGQPCPQLLNGNSPITSTGDPTVSNTQEVVGENPGYPCQQLICVASGGTAGYCSGKCLDDSACPTGFDCRQVQSGGPYATTKFCAWKECTTARDCGSIHDFCCNSITGANPNQSYHLCSFKTQGKCS